MMTCCDLHTHSVFSDGTNTPAEILGLAEQCGLTAVALCDHNTVDGLPDFLQAAKHSTVKAICGAEFSVDYDGIELHLLGLWMDPIHFSAISDLMKDVRRRKEESNRALIRALSEAGYSLDYTEICQRTPSAIINRAHIAAALTEKGYTPSISAAFDTLLSKQAGYYREPKRLSVWEVLSFLCSIRAVPILAHPLLNLNENQLRVFLPSAKEHGLIGMETFYSLYTEEMTNTALRLANNARLLPSGGSDYHGANKPNIHLGIGTGNLRVPAHLTDALQKAIK